MEFLKVKFLEGLVEAESAALVVHLSVAPQTCRNLKNCSKTFWLMLFGGPHLTKAAQRAIL